MKLMVFDGNSILNRSYYGIRPLTNHDGLYTHAVFGFLTTFLRMKADERPDACCVTFDVHAPTFRHKADTSYKANRKPMPEELRVQLPVIREALDALRIPRYELSGWEADDLLGTISRKCETDGWECVIVTGDKDALQLITDRTKVKLVSTQKGRTVTTDMTPGAFREQYGFDPVHLIDLKALMGDTSDNIPGVAGVGEKTALALIRKYQTIDALYAQMPEIDAKPAVIRKLAAGEENARHSYWLASIVTDAPLEFDPDKNLCQSPGPEAYPLFVKLEFNRLIDRFGLVPPAPQIRNLPAEPVTGVYSMEYLTDAETVEQAVTVLRESGKTVYIRADASLDTVVLYYAGEHGTTAYSLNRENFNGSYNAALQGIFHTDFPKAGHHIKDFQRILLSCGCDISGWVCDTALAAYLLDAVAGEYDLNRLCLKYCGIRIDRASDAGEGEQLSLLDGSPETWNPAKHTADLAAEAAAVASLRETLEPMLKEQRMDELYQSAELPLCRILSEMEQTGCLVDKDALSAFGEMLSRRIAEQEELVYSLAGETFNLNSPKQLGEILFGRLSLPHGKKTKTGWSTNADVLENLREHPIVNAVLEYRQYAKLKSTYADGLLRAMDTDGRVRTSFQMTATATGRLSSTEPNLQNIPVRTDLGSEIRKMFVSAPGYVLVDADYSQIELRILAHISGDASMKRAFLDGMDIHTATAAQVFRVSPEDVTAQMRRSAKAVNFGIVYGISPFSLSQDIGVSVADAKTYMDAYFDTFPGVRQYMDHIIAQAKTDGFVETLFHRRRALPELSSSRHTLRQFGERVALNMPVQGTAADIMKLAMVKVWRRLKKECPRARLALQIHDELIAECPEEDRETAAEILREEMENAAQLSVPLTVDAHWGKNWLDAKG